MDEYKEWTDEQMDGEGSVKEIRMNGWLAGEESIRGEWVGQLSGYE